mmetsp:Transcript_1372/g.3790  ORF Transcript_1372/g.3790 Transcript_1372/m.3790 type:complete len:270 (-) Transcript_1372:59-868(-)
MLELGHGVRGVVQAVLPATPGAAAGGAQVDVVADAALEPPRCRIGAVTGHGQAHAAAIACGHARRAARHELARAADHILHHVRRDGDAVHGRGHVRLHDAGLGDGIRRRGRAGTTASAGTPAGSRASPGLSAVARAGVAHVAQEVDRKVETVVIHGVIGTARPRLLSGSLLQQRIPVGVVQVRVHVLHVDVDRGAPLCRRRGAHGVPEVVYHGAVGGRQAYVQNLLACVAREGERSRAILLGRNSSTCSGCSGRGRSSGASAAGSVCAG